MPNTKKKINKNKSKVIPKKKIQSPLDAFSESPIGTIEIFHKMRSEYLNGERDFAVWLPSSYFNKINKRYPVLYVHDGQNIFDPKTSYSGYDWRIDEWVTYLIAVGKIEEIIVVGIYNTSDRLAEYSDSNKGNGYLHFITEELKVYIDMYFRTKPDRENTAVMGSSMGGLCSLLLLWKRNSIFSKAACLSSSFYYRNDAVFKMIADTKKKMDVKLYLDSGEDGKRDAQKMFALLTQQGYILGDEIDYFYDRGAQHNEFAWSNRLQRPLLFLFGK